MDEKLSKIAVEKLRGLIENDDQERAHAEALTIYSATCWQLLGIRK